jgi:hypothetical protein
MISNNEELDLLEQLIASPGYALFIKIIQSSYDNKYSKLLTTNRDTAFYKLQGALKENEYIRNIIKDEISEYNSIKGEAKTNE